MNLEIERKYRVTDRSYRTGATRCTYYKQGYLSTNPAATVRIRIAGGQAFITVKGTTTGCSRQEYEYPIPVADAAAMLGRPWSFTGTVVRGRGLAGPSLGVPTANIPYRGRGGERMAPLAHGVYRAVAQVGGRRWPALLNFGTAPSVKGLAEPLFEAHLLGASGDLYGAEITLSLSEPRLRPERAFPTLEALRAQIRADLEACR